MSRPIKRTVGFAIAGDGDADEPPAPSGDGDLGVGSPSPVLITPHFDGGAGVHSGAGSSPADEMTRGVRSSARARRGHVPGRASPRARAAERSLDPRREPRERGASPAFGRVAVGSREPLAREGIAIGTRRRKPRRPADPV
jgi:hypothetical protein